MHTPASVGGGAPTRIVFSTDDLRPARRLEAWNAAFGSLNAITPIAGVRDDLVGTHTENWLLGGGLLLSSTRVSPSRFVRDAARARRDGLDQWVLRVLRRGQSGLRCPDFAARLGPGELVLLSANRTWLAEWTEAEWVSITIARDAHPRISAGLGALSPGPVRGPAAGLLADMMLALPIRVAMASGAAEVEALAAATRAAVAACLLTGGPTPPPQTVLAATSHLRKQQARQAIMRHVASARLTPERLAAAAGISRATLYRLFEAEGGVARYIRDVRLSLVHDALRDPAQAGRSIAHVAEAHGFHGPSAFSRAFRTAYGVTPGEVRGSALAGPAPPTRGARAKPPVAAVATGNVAAQLYSGSASA